MRPMAQHMVNAPGRSSIRVDRTLRRGVARPTNRRGADGRPEGFRHGHRAKNPVAGCDVVRTEVPRRGPERSVFDIREHRTAALGPMAAGSAFRNRICVSRQSPFRRAKCRMLPRPGAPRPFAVVSTGSAGSAGKWPLERRWLETLSFLPCRPACSLQSTASCRAAFRRPARSGANRSCGGCP